VLRFKEVSRLRDVFIIILFFFWGVFYFLTFITVMVIFEETTLRRLGRFDRGIFLLLDLR
jgi:hypothetical protein